MEGIPLKNERGAGRKSKISEKQFEEILTRISNGETVSKLAIEYGISRQAIYKRVRNRNTEQTISLDYVVDNICVTHIEADMKAEVVRIFNYATKLSLLPFGFDEKPSWDDFCHLLEMEYFKAKGIDGESGYRQFLIQDSPTKEFLARDILERKNTSLKFQGEDDSLELPVFQFTKKELLYARTDTDGFQMKALSRDRRHFVKSQAMISGVYMDDWAVEIIASDICEHIGIPHVKQKRCQFAYAGKLFNAVYSKNFEMDGYCFISFERLLERMGLSSRDKEFIKLDAIQKLKWCAQKLSDAGDIPYEETQRYMLNLALVDCLVGNVDRHTKNFGLFYNSIEGKYEIPLLFDNGMGLFEHDGYKNTYETFDEAMMTVYVSPYGEDPFDMIQMLEKEFHLLEIYPGLKTLKIQSEWMTPFAMEYIERMLSIWQK